MTFTYKIVELLSSEDTSVAEAALNELAAEGWEVQEVFGVAGKGDTTCFLMRRPVAAAATDARGGDAAAMSWPSQ
ncbi:MAG TPA: DUF4177 domain-containing protein [Acidimicrobiales bacterium]|nr:DUF4177 domain-containing protein [Acidimicrobiales bacterium]